MMMRGVVRRMSKRWEPIRLTGVGGMPQYEGGSDGGVPLLVIFYY